MTGERQILHFYLQNEEDYTVHYRSVSLIPDPGKIKEQESISGFMKEKKATGKSQHEFTKGKSNLNNLIRYTVRGRPWMLFILSSVKLSMCSSPALLNPSWEVTVYMSGQLAR